MKQTAVEWLVANIDWQLLRNTKTHYNMIVEKAIKMEKEQMKNACIQHQYENKAFQKLLEKQFEQYYKETFKSE